MRIHAILTLTLVAAFTAKANELPISNAIDLHPISGVDLGIADDETFKRPNSWSKIDAKPEHFAERRRPLPTERLLVGDRSGPASRPAISIAWRNAAQVEEVEVRVRNLGDQPGEGRVHVDVLDETGTTLLELNPPEELATIRVPAFQNGGREGKIIRMRSSRELNNIIDQFDRAHRRYDVRATVETLGATDANPYDNTKTKSWNVSHRVDPGFRNVFNFVYKNHEEKAVRVKWLFEHTAYPNGWVIHGVPKSNAAFVIAGGAEIRGSLWLDAPRRIDEGAFVESRLTLVREDSGTVWQQHEWFQVHDTEPPVVTDYRLVATADHRIAIQALVADQGSGVLEATGVSSEFSTDNGLTWGVMAHNYKAGKFVVPTLFEAVLGPFTPGTTLQLRFMARDTAGNVTATIPTSATAIQAPSSAEKLLDLARVFPRTQPNMIFTLEPGTVNLGTVAAQFAAAIARSSDDPVQLESIANVLRGVPVSADGRQLLLTAASSIGDNPTRRVTADRLREIVENLPVTPEGESTVVPLTMARVDAPGAATLKMTTLEVKVQ